MTRVFLQEITDVKMSVQAQDVCQSGMHFDMKSLKGKCLSIYLSISHANTLGRVIGSTYSENWLSSSIEILHDEGRD